MPFRRPLHLALAALLLMLGSTPLHADMAQAAALYKAGRAKQAAKDYRGAIADYSASLAAEPRYVFSQRERATCRYYLGDKAGALADYSAYSAKNPKDVKTAALVRKLQAAQGPARAAGAATPGQAPAAAGQARPKWGLSLGGGFNTYAMGDWNESFSGPSTASGGPISSGIGAGGRLSWRVAPAVMIDFDIDYLMASSQRKGTTFTDDYSLPLTWLGFGGAYVMGFGSLDLRLGGGLGYTMLNGSYSSKGSAPGSTAFTAEASGNGFGLKVFAGLDYFFGRHVALGLDLGYRLASVSPVTVKSGNFSGTLIKTNPTTGQPAGNLAIDYSGLLSKLSLSYWF